VTKIDLAQACEFDRRAAYENLQAIRPGIQILETSARTGAGMQDWLEYIVGGHQKLLESRDLPATP
jgi:hydrogenase nickel incorporation protein HypB